MKTFAWANAYFEDISILWGLVSTKFVINRMNCDLFCFQSKRATSVMIKINSIYMPDRYKSLFVID